jgi:hypothetical protein
MMLLRMMVVEPTEMTSNDDSRDFENAENNKYYEISDFVTHHACVCGQRLRQQSMNTSRSTSRSDLIDFDQEVEEGETLVGEGIVANPLYEGDEETQGDGTADWNGRIQMWRRPVSRRRLVETATVVETPPPQPVYCSRKKILEKVLEEEEKVERRKGNDGRWTSHYLSVSDAYCARLPSPTPSRASAPCSDASSREITPEVTNNSRVTDESGSLSESGEVKAFKKLPWHANLHLLRTK